MVDVDGSYLHRKHQHLTASRVSLAPLEDSSPPITGWESVTEENVHSLVQNIPKVTTGEAVLLFVLKLLHKLLYKLLYTFFTAFNKGMVYSYLSGALSRTGDEGAFRVLSCGYTHWASGCLNATMLL